MQQQPNQAAVSVAAHLDVNTVRHCQPALCVSFPALVASASSGPRVTPTPTPTPATAAATATAAGCVMAAFGHGSVAPVFDFDEDRTRQQQHQKSHHPVNQHLCNGGRPMSLSAAAAESQSPGSSAPAPHSFASAAVATAQPAATAITHALAPRLSASALAALLTAPQAMMCTADDLPASACVSRSSSCSSSCGSGGSAVSVSSSSSAFFSLPCDSPMSPSASSLSPFSDAPVSSNHVASSGNENCVVLDCRSPALFAEAHIRGSVLFTGSSLLLRRFAKSTDCEANFPNALAALGVTASPATALHGPYIIVTDPSPCTHARARFLIELFANANRNILELQGGFDVFGSLFPQLCVRASAVAGGPAVGQVQRLRRNNKKTSASPTACRKRPTSCEEHAKTPLRTISRDGQQCTAHHAITPCPALEEPPSQLLPFLLIGGQQAAQDIEFLKAKGVTHILTLTEQPLAALQSNAGSLNMLHLPLSDTLQEDLLPTLWPALQFIDAAKEKQGKVLVHCAAGRSRSVSVGLGYLVACKGMTLAAALKLIKEQRPTSSPNLNFVGQLLSLERRLAATTTTVTN